MTPEEAVEQLGERLTTGRLETVKKLIDACVATAQADETRRCATRARAYTTLQWGNTIADDILVSGGLEPGK